MLTVSPHPQVTDAVHEKKSFIYLQLWALGRAASPEVIEKDGHPFVSASNLPIEAGKKAPRALSTGEIKEYVELWAQAARNAVHRAGFDGVEIHGANGTLLSLAEYDSVSSDTVRAQGTLSISSSRTFRTSAQMNTEGPLRIGLVSLSKLSKP
jgi:NADPH2 dehydrogenase